MNIRHVSPNQFINAAPSITGTSAGTSKSTGAAAGHSGAGSRLSAEQKKALRTNQRNMSGAQAGSASYTAGSTSSYVSSGSANGETSDAAYKKPVFKASSASVLDTARTYSQSLKLGRQQAKDTSTSLKKLQYQFKSVSSQILRSKTSTAARKAVSQAKREIQRLKSQKSSGQYDAEEIDAALAHAKAMERVAKKKVQHLEEEELAKASGKIWNGRSYEAEEAEDTSKETSPAEEDEFDEEGAEDAYNDALYTGSNFQDTYSDYAADTALAASDDMSAALSPEYAMELMGEFTEELTEEMTEAMQELMEEMGLEDLSDSLFAASGNMDADDLKEMQIKHRNKEMKALVKADADFMKATFERYKKMQAQGIATGSETTGTASNSPHINTEAMTHTSGAKLAHSTDVHPALSSHHAPSSGSFIPGMIPSMPQPSAPAMPSIDITL